MIELETRILPSFAFSEGKIFHIENGKVIDFFTPFEGFGGEANIDNDGASLVVGVINGPPHVKVFDLPSLAEKSSFYAYSPEFLGGINVSISKDKIATGPEVGPPHYKEFDLSGLELTSIYVGNPNSLSGVKPSLVKDVSEKVFQSNPLAENILEINFTPDFPKYIQENVLNYVSDYLSAFNVNVTNTSLAYSGFNVYRSVVGGGLNDYNFRTEIPDFVKGVSDAFAKFRSGDFTFNTSYVFAKDLDYNPIKVANGIVHEFIHQIGFLVHSSDPRSVFSPNILPVITYIDEVTANFIKNRLV